MQTARQPHASDRIGRQAQFNQFPAELIQQAGKSPRRSLIGGTHLRLDTTRLDDKIDRAVLQMQPLAVRKKRDLRQPFHARRPGM